MHEYKKNKEVFRGDEFLAKKEFLIEMANFVGMNDLEKENWIKSWGEKKLMPMYYLSDEEKVWLNKVCALWTNSQIDDKEREICRKFIIKIIKKNPCFFAKEFNNDRKIVIEAVTKYGTILRKVSEELRNDKEIVIAAVKCSKYSIKYASIELQNDREFLKVLKRKRN